MVDQVKCVVCEVVEYAVSTGKNARIHAGVCARCEPSLFKEVSDAKAKNEPGSVAQGVSARKQG